MSSFQPGQEVWERKFVEQVIEGVLRKDDLSLTKAQLDALADGLMPILISQLASAFPALIAAPLQQMADATRAECVRMLAERDKWMRELVAKWRDEVREKPADHRGAYETALETCAHEVETTLAKVSTMSFGANPPFTCQKCGAKTMSLLSNGLCDKCSGPIWGNLPI